jgi:hypothetical protein
MDSYKKFHEDRHNPCAMELDEGDIFDYGPNIEQL